jgi:DNA-binding CsgD family transcriptional regulator
MMGNTNGQLLRDSLTERENEILKRLSAGLSDQEIADELFLSLNTVKWYNRQIYSKLGVSSRTQAIAQAKERGVLDSDVPRSLLPIAKTNLPAPITPFIGRRREIAEVKQLMLHRAIEPFETPWRGATTSWIRMRRRYSRDWPSSGEAARWKPSRLCVVRACPLMCSMGWRPWWIRISCSSRRRQGASRVLSCWR